MSARIPIKEGIKLYGLSEGNEFRYFKILGELENGRGSSVISYKAKYKALDNKFESGVLREFYPKVAINLNREKDGQLSSADKFGAAKIEFDIEEKKYLEKYKLLLELKNINKNNVLGTFIPYFEIYQGMDGDKNKIGSTYVWTPAPALTTFAKVCEGIRKRPYNRPEYNLAFILKSMEILVKCVKLLHGADLLHLDINPKNFGFMKREKELLYQTLQMFDISTIASVYNVEEKRGTLGYVESELFDERNIPTVKTDIYAIGATLFNAIIILDDLKDTDYLYNDVYFKDLKYMVDNSKLIQASEHNYHPKLRYVLTRILEKCLCRRADRYGRCEDLLEDLNEAIYYIMPAALEKQGKSKDIWVLSDIERYLDSKKMHNARTSILYHMFQEPLYKYCQWDKNEINDINVAVIGLGNLGRYFLDNSLQFGQINNARININVFTNNALDKAVYVNDRPALAKFFSIDAKGHEEDDSYGRIAFINEDLREVVESRKAKLIKRNIFMHNGDKYPHYIFIALGNNELNFSVAKMCRKVADENKISCSINFVYTGNKIDDDEIKGINPIYIYKEITKSVLHKEIERMAYNVHLLWEPDFGVDEKIIRKRFRNSYNYLSCVSNVISTRYKLFSIGIDLEELSLKDASIRFDIECKGQILDTLIWCEHKRWVTEKITAGWSQLNDLSECSGGKTRDFKHKRHVCIVRSNDISTLDGWSLNNFEKWDSATEEELATLDDLDRMSVLLHRVYKKDAADVRVKNLFNSEALMNIREAVKKDRCLLSKCLEWINAAKALWNRESSKVRLYKGIKNQFLDSLQSLKKETQKEINEQIDIFEKSFNPIICELEHKDYKKLDVDLVRKIPYILTYSTSNYLVVPYINETDLSSGNSRRFSNVASAMCINPGRIIYICDLRREENISGFGKSISAVLNLMERKKLRSVIDLVVITKAMDNKGKIEPILEQLQMDYSSRLREIKVIDTLTSFNWLEELFCYLKGRSKGKKFFALEKNETNISGYLEGNEVFNSFACYEFDSCKREFSFVRGCEEISFLKSINGTKASLSITVPDIIALDNSINLVENEPEFYMDYERLWDYYKDYPSAWKLLCNELEDFSYGNDLVARFYIGGPVNSNPLKPRYIVPLKCITHLKTLFNELSQNNIIGKNYSLESISTEACEVRFSDLRNNKKIFDELFKKLVTFDYSIEMNYKIEGNYLKISYDNLLVTNMVIGNTYKSQKIRVLRLLSSQGFILGLNIENDVISFAYSTKRIKDLLTCAGRILEIYIYHKAKDMGCFDDVVAGCQVFWDKSEVKNEMDIIITYGFRSIFIESKSRKNGLNAEMYEKLNMLISRFGINAKALLIADDLGNDISNSKVHMERGEKLNIKTIYKEKDIANIDKIILNMFTNV